VLERVSYSIFTVVRCLYFAFRIGANDYSVLQSNLDIVIISLFPERETKRKLVKLR